MSKKGSKTKTGGSRFQESRRLRYTLFNKTRDAAVVPPPRYNRATVGLGFANSPVQQRSIPNEQKHVFHGGLLSRLAPGSKVDGAIVLP
jgi:hypothetical protein